MKATDLVFLALKICQSKDRSRQKELFNSCPSHLQSLLRTNISIVRENKKRQQAKERFKRQKHDYCFTYKFQPLPKRQSKPKALIPEAALRRCSALREQLGVS